MKFSTPIFLLCGASLCFFLTSACSEKSSSSSGSAQEAAIRDPDGVYKTRCDPSITKAPAENVLLGKGEVVEIQYDGSKGDGLDYQLFYVDTNGSVHPMSGSNFEKKGGGIYSRDIVIFNSSAHQRPGFMEITTVSDSGLDADGKIKGKVVSLGMFPVRFEVSE